MNNYNFLFIYICTGTYKRMFSGFAKSLPNFGYADNITYNINVLTDDINYNFKKYETSNIKIHCYYINHLPWPLITLLKMHYINNFTDANVDAIFYCNCNLRFLPVKHIDKNILYNNKIKLYNVNIPGWTEKNKYVDELYVNGTFFWGNPKCIKHLCEFVINQTNNNLLYNIILDKHDENLMNMYVLNYYNTDIYEIYTHDDIFELDNDIHLNGKYIDNFKKLGYDKPVLVLDLEKNK